MTSNRASRTSEWKSRLLRNCNTHQDFTVLQNPVTPAWSEKNFRFDRAVVRKFLKALDKLSADGFLCGRLIAFENEC